MDYSGIPRSSKPSQLAQSVNDARRHLEQLSSARTGVNRIADQARTAAVEQSVGQASELVEQSAGVVLETVRAEAIEQATQLTEDILTEADTRLEAAA